MKFWVDAQLPPALAVWLKDRFGVQAFSLHDLGMRDAADSIIFNAARRDPGVVIISKDGDFVDLISRHGVPPQLLWVTCGNVTNPGLQALFEATFSTAVATLDSGQAIVELA